MDAVLSVVVQVGVESAAGQTGRVVVAGTVRYVTRERGDFATDLFEIARAARRAEEDAARPRQPTPPDHAGSSWSAGWTRSRAVAPARA
jgi:hypothetical protein